MNYQDNIIVSTRTSLEYRKPLDQIKISKNLSTHYDQNLITNYVQSLQIFNLERNVTYEFSITIQINTTTGEFHEYMISRNHTIREFSCLQGLIKYHKLMHLII